MHGNIILKYHLGKIKQVLIYWYLYKLIVGFGLLLSIYNIHCTVADLQYTLASLYTVYILNLVDFDCGFKYCYLFRSIVGFKCKNQTVINIIMKLQIIIMKTH